MKYYNVTINRQRYEMIASNRFAAAKKGINLWIKDIKTSDSVPRDIIYGTFDINISVHRIALEDMIGGHGDPQEQKEGA